MAVGVPVGAAVGAELVGMAVGAMQDMRAVPQRPLRWVRSLLLPLLLLLAPRVSAARGEPEFLSFPVRIPRTRDRDPTENYLL